MYADDTLLLNSGKDVQQTVSKSQNMMNIVAKWCNTNKLTINIDKTKCMLISPAQIDCTVDCNVKIGDSLLSRVHVYEYLGVHIDDKLNMNAQIDKVCKKVQQKHGILKKIRRFVTQGTALAIYKTMIRPHFDYGDYMIDSGCQNKIRKIDRIQDKIIRTIEYKWTKEKRENLDILRVKYNIEKLVVRRKRSLLKIMYKQSR